MKKLIKLFRKYILKKKPVRKHNFGFIKDKWDHRDIYYKIRKYGYIPPTTNRKNISEFTYRYDQGQIGSCVANGVVTGFRRSLQMNKQPDFDASRLFTYWIARDDKNNDTGASIRDAFKAINKYGICSEMLWPYIPVKFASMPISKAFKEAEDHQAITYERIYPVTKEAIQDAVSRGFVVVYGKMLYESFMSAKVAKTGGVSVPSKCEDEIGGHCMTIFDYDKEGTIELNSWGKDWGIDGTCHVPWKYVLDSKLCSDFWVLYKTE
jgi:C1A family cysteine protease